MHTERNNSKNKRRDRDFYPTPPELASAALRAFGNYTIGTVTERIFDPGCGTGVWGKAAREIWPEAVIDGMDLEPHVPQDDTAYNIVMTGDYLKWGGGFYDLVMGNPPYGIAEKFVRHAMASLRPFGVCMFLLRLEFLASGKRYRGLWQEYKPSSVLVLPQRPSFTGDGKTDAMEYAMFIWQRNVKATTEIDWLPWR